MATFHYSFKISLHDFWPKFAKITKSIALLFDQNCTILVTFHSCPLKISPQWFLAKIRAILSQVYSLTFCSKLHVFWPLFTLHSKSVLTDFEWPKFAKSGQSRIALLFAQKVRLDTLGHFWRTLHSKSCPHDFEWRAKIRQNTKCMSLTFCSYNCTYFGHFFTLHSKSCPPDLWPKFAKIPSV